MLCVVSGQCTALKEWGRVTQGIASALAEVECLRTRDRLRLAQGFADEMIVEQREAVYRLLEPMEIAESAHRMLSRAAQRRPTALATPDAIHHATALRWKEHSGKGLSMATQEWHRLSPRRQAGCALSKCSGWHPRRVGTDDRGPAGEGNAAEFCSAIPSETTATMALQTVSPHYSGTDLGVSIGKSATLRQSVNPQVAGSSPGRAT